MLRRCCYLLLMPVKCYHHLPQLFAPNTHIHTCTGFSFPKGFSHCFLFQKFLLSSYISHFFRVETRGPSQRAMLIYHLDRTEACSSFSAFLSYSLFFRTADYFKNIFFQFLLKDLSGFLIISYNYKLIYEELTHFNRRCSHLAIYYMTWNIQVLFYISQ